MATTTLVTPLAEEQPRREQERRRWTRQEKEWNQVDQLRRAAGDVVGFVPPTDDDGGNPLAGNQPGQFEDAWETDEGLNDKGKKGPSKAVGAQKRVAVVVELPPANDVTSVADKTPTPFETVTEPTAKDDDDKKKDDDNDGKYGNEEGDIDKYNDKDDEEFDDDYDDDGFDDHDNEADDNVFGPSKFVVNLNPREEGPANLSHKVSNSVSRMQDLALSKRLWHTGRDDRATVEQCLDPRTRLILFKLLSSGLLESIDGCLSTGKEANVYYAKAGARLTATTATHSKKTRYKSPALLTSEKTETINTTKKTTTSSSSFQQQPPQWLDSSPETPAATTPPEVPTEEVALKIYKTSILVFRDRDKYVAGEHRWRRGYCKSNPRKMVQVWAEKEMRNYRRMYHAGIPTPRPLLLKSHVLLMQFLGNEHGWPSPRLKDASLSPRRLREAYVQAIAILRRLYVQCRLVHGDFSEYNLLWHQQQLYVIDVSQSVETDHPLALDFLRRDCAHLNDFFARHQLQVLSTRQLFDHVTAERRVGLDENDDEEERDWQALQTLMQQVEEEKGQSPASNAQVEDAVFLSQFLPQSLNQVADSDVNKLQSGEAEESYATAVAALTSTLPETTTNKDEETTGTVNHKKDEEDDGHVPILVNGNNLQEQEESEQEDDDNDEEETVYEDAMEEEDDDDDLDEEEDDDLDDEDDIKVKFVKTPEQRQAEQEERRCAQKEHKKLIKEQNAERRRNKVSKKDKQKALKRNKKKKKKT